MSRCLIVAVAVVVLAVLPATVSAHGEHGVASIGWTGSLNGFSPYASFASADPSLSSETSTAGISNLQLVGNSDHDGAVNSDLAFWGDLAYAGNFGGFRILNISTDQPSEVVDLACNGAQSDVSVHEMGGRRFLFQSVDTPQTSENCSSTSAPIINGGRVGFEGVRVFDVTDPAQPAFLDMIQTACGSHTHTVLPRDGEVFIYVSSYPLGANITPAGSDTSPFGPEFQPCVVPHAKISIIRASAPDGSFQYTRKEHPLSADTTEFEDSFQACHDIQVFEPRSLAIAACAGDAQIWDVSDPWNPTSNVEGRHTHIRSPSATDEFEFVHSGVATWDGRHFAIMDETGGGVTANCFGGASQDGFYYFYDLVRPGKRAPALISRYTIPRDQGDEPCVSHNASVVPVRGRYIMTAAYYQGGVSVVDFTNVRKPMEIAFADLEDSTGDSDEWSSYWYNGRIFSNGGLSRRSSNRGLDVFRPAPSLGLASAATWRRSNPQTQEAWQAP